MSQNFSNYFNSYQNRSPQWTERVHKTGNATPGLDAESEKLYERVTEKTYPKLYHALKAECEFRGVDIPACYVDRSGKTRLGRALQEDYTLLIDAKSNGIFNDKEMRALMAHELKHLYQGAIETTQQSIEAEYDSDRAAVGSTDFDTIRSYVDKAIHMMIDEKVPSSVLRKFAHAIHDTFPGAIAQSVIVQIDQWHPSPASRMRAMRSADCQNNTNKGRQ